MTLCDSSDGMCDAVESRHDIVGRLAEIQSEINLNRSSWIKQAQKHDAKLEPTHGYHCINSPDKTKEIQTLKTLMGQQSWLWNMML
ncbi:hypothetical protein NQZ68_037948 [Dissostichus eleginoides]|nr:hypothetical protein NQZ68_037948 [Dissostichus eleginoides]